jgi:hypothetical protein
MFQALSNWVRGTAVPQYADADNKPLSTNPRGDLLVAQGLPFAAEAVRMGNTWSAAVPTASAFTLVAAYPSTRAELGLFNGDPKKSYLIRSAWAIQIVTTTVAGALTLVGQQLPIPSTGVANNTAVLVTSRAGKPNYGGAAQLYIAQTNAIANKWEVMATGPTSAAANVGAAVYAQLDGSWIVPPGGTLLLNCIAGTAVAASGVIGVTWDEVLTVLA